jgi:hypothetical protein
MKRFLVLLVLGGTFVLIATQYKVIAALIAQVSQGLAEEPYLLHMPAIVEKPTDGARKAKKGVIHGRQIELMEVDPEAVKKHTVKVRLEETVDLIADWCGIPAAHVRHQNALGAREKIREGKQLKLTLTGRQLEGFLDGRKRFHDAYRNAFYDKYEPERTVYYKVRPGDVIEKVIKRQPKPLTKWLIRDYNPGLNLRILPAGKSIIIPRHRKKRRVGRNSDVVYTTEKYAYVNVEARLGESLALYSKWSASSVEDIMADNELDSRELALGQLLNVKVFPSRVKSFNTKRETYRAEYAQELADRYYVVHTLKHGQTLWGLAQQRTVSFELLKSYNTDKNFKRLSPGARIRVPITKKPYAELDSLMKQVR